jgi:small-conductance mechanosensitive channel
VSSWDSVEVFAVRGSASEARLESGVSMAYHEPLAVISQFSVTFRRHGSVTRPNRSSLTLLARAAAIVFLLSAVAAPSWAWQNYEESAPAQEKQGYPVIVGGYEVFRVHQNLGAASAQERAARISAGLEELAMAQDFNPADVKANEEGGVATLRYGDQLVVTINDAEAQGSGLPRKALAMQYAKLVGEKVALAREQRTVRYLWRAAAWAGATLLVYVLLIWLVWRGSRWVVTTLKTLAASRMKGIKIQQSEILRGERLVALLVSMVRTLRNVMLAVLTYLTLAKVFRFFPWTRQHGDRLLGYITGPLVSLGNAVLNYLPKAFYIFVILLAIHFLQRFVHIIAVEMERGRIRLPNFYPEWAQPTYKIVRILIYAFAAVMIYPYLPGESSPAFKGISVFLGVLFSLGSTSAVANFVAGIILIYTRGFRVGDWVTIGENTGEVAHTSMLATHLRTIRNEEITIPNSVVLGSFVTNFSLQAKDRGVVLHTSVTIGYDAPWRTVHQLLIDAALKTKFVQHEPAPFVLQSDLLDSNVRYEINAYTDHPLQMPFIYSDLHANIQDSFFEAGVEIMSPIFHALRDGNHVAMPEKYLPKGYRAPGFRVNQIETNEGEGGPHS